jgi:hypothetical protein
MTHEEESQLPITIGIRATVSTAYCEEHLEIYREVWNLL